MDKLEKIIYGLRCISMEEPLPFCATCPYANNQGGFKCRHNAAKDALELLKEPRKTKDEILFAIVSAIGYESVDAFKETAEEVGSLDEFMIGMNRSINAVEKLFAKDGEQE